MNSATALFEVRRSRRLVISFFATVGNYDYGFYWYLYQDGTIQLEIKLTGIIQTAAVRPARIITWGGMVDDDLGGPTHQHFFNVRLHMDARRRRQHRHRARVRAAALGPDNPHGNAFDTTTRVLSRERDAAAIANGETGRSGRSAIPTRPTSVGNATGLQARGQSEPADAGAGGQLRAQARRLCHQARLGDGLSIRTRNTPAANYPNQPCRRRRPAELCRAEPQHRE